MRVLSIAATLFMGLLLFACGGSGDDQRATPTPDLPNVTSTPDQTSGTPQPAPTELRVAFINLGSPITIDENDRIAEETFLERLEMVIAELKEFGPDIVAVTDATWTNDLGSSAWDVLASGLRMEPQFLRANPWFRDQDREASDATRDLAGWEEGDAILSRYPIRWAKRIPLNPRTSENEGRIAMHAVLLIEPYGEVNVYISRLSGSAETRSAQAADLKAAIDRTKDDRPTIIFADLGLEPESEGVAVFTTGGYIDLGARATGENGTCCRAAMLFNIPEGTIENGEETVSPLPEAEETPADQTEAPADEELAERRTVYVFSDVWPAEEYGIFGHQPKVRVDESRLYASDHNGVLAVISLQVPWSEIPMD